MSADPIADRFRHHPPTGDRGELHHQVRSHIGALAEQLNYVVPAGHESSLMMTKLEEAMFWANAGIARSAVESPALLNCPCSTCQPKPPEQ